MAASTVSRWRIALRGALIALIVAAVIGVVVIGSVLLIGGTVAAALVAAAYLAGLYLGLNLIVLMVGLLIRPSASWSIGAALATPVVVAAIGFGFTVYKGIPS